METRKGRRYLITLPQSEEENPGYISIGEKTAEMGMNEIIRNYFGSEHAEIISINMIPGLNGCALLIGDGDEINEKATKLARFTGEGTIRGNALLCREEPDIVDFFNDQIAGSIYESVKTALKA